VLSNVVGDAFVILPVCIAGDRTLFVTVTYDAHHTVEPRNEQMIVAMVPIIEQALQNALSHKEVVDRDNARESIINRLVHDIRSPLMSTSASIDVIQRVLKQSPIEQKLQDFILESLESGKRGMQEVINLSKDLLDIKKMQTDVHELEYEEVLLEFVFDEVHKLLYGLAVQKKVIMRYKVEPRALKLHADMRLIQRAVVNLAANALRFSPSGGTVTLKAYQVADSTDIMVVVEDMGAGVPKEER
jgi:K+-sensing histidine kinase KdpD